MKGLEGLINGGRGRWGAITGQKKCFKASYIAVLIKILFEFDRLYELQNIVKSQIHFNAC